jgi:uncharacterized protein (TIGR03435 family)
MQKVAIATFLLAFATLPAHAQAAASATPASIADAQLPGFDVVSIKRNKSGPGPAMIISPIDSDRIIVRNASPWMIIGEAYGIRLHDLITGAPTWADAEVYDIEAKVAASDLPAFHNLLPGQRNPMLRTLLADRFHLICHFETRTLPAYALVVLKGGPKLAEIQPGILSNGLKDPGGIDMSHGALTATGSSMQGLAHVLQMQLGRPVVDRTGLTGNYNFKLNWTPDSGATAVPADAESGPSIFTALQEQLGLKLESNKAAVEVLVVDHIERPSED